MPVTPIRAVIFDLGGTLEDVRYSDDGRLHAAEGLRQLLAARGIDPGLGPLELRDAVAAGMKRVQAAVSSTIARFRPQSHGATTSWQDAGCPARP